jgi:hypothetical protein
MEDGREGREGGKEGRREGMRVGLKSQRAFPHEFLLTSRLLLKREISSKR